MSIRRPGRLTGKPILVPAHLVETGFSTSMRQLVILLFLLLTVFRGYPQSVGLVLSGGGAKGLAHIAVIRALEANDIPIDYITGTSIGAIIGGLYAAGYTPDEMEELIRSDEFYFWSTGKIQEEFRYFFKQREENPSWIELKMAKREDKLKLLPPTNLIPQWQMDFAFLELTAASTAISGDNFDKLFIPFRCVATEVHQNLPVVLSRGDLGEAIRSSMTFPLVFKPIQIEGKLLFDGGIVNNFPQDVMAETFHPDIIIGHKVVDGPKTAAADDIMQQITNMIQRPTDYTLTPEQGILLETKLTNIGLMDFPKITSIIEAGNQTIYPMLDSIKSRIKRRVDHEEVARRREAFNANKPALLFQNIQVEGIADPLQRRYIINSIKHNKNIFTLEVFRKEYFKLIADEQIKSIRPVALFNEETGYFDVHLIVEPETKGTINIGGNVSTKPVNQGYVNFEYRLFKNRSYTLASNLYFGRFYSSFKVGGRIDFPSLKSFYLASYLTYNRWDFFASSNELFFEDVRPPYIIQNESSFRNEIGFPAGLHGKVTTGISWSGSRDVHYQNNRYNKTDTPDKSDFNASVFHAEYEKNSLNQKQYATEGIYNLVSSRFIAGKEHNIPGTTAPDRSSWSDFHSHFLIRAQSLRYYPLSRTLTLGSHLEGVFSNRKPFRNYTATLLSAPGFFPTPHSKTLFIENFRSDNFIAGGLKGIYQMNPQVHVRLEVYAFLPIFELKNTLPFPPLDDLAFFDNYYFQGLAAVVMNTGAGPLSVAINYYDKSITKWYLSLNFGYILFNRKGI